MAPLWLLLTVAVQTAATAAQTTTLTMPFVLWEQFDISASVISANPTATTYSLVCGTATSATASSRDPAECGFFPTHHLVHGPSTWMMEMGVPSGAAAFTGTMDCGANMGKPTVTCTESFGGKEAGDPGSSTTEHPASEVSSIKVVVTGGVEKLKAASAMATPASASASPTGSATVAKSPSPSPAPASSKAVADRKSVGLGGGSFAAAAVAALGGLVL
ncbi:hypothetical protein DM02DRAFT_614735 [Periconia macrospinosa]|uniref:GPI anchored protein n=1 Tax=Periconia macrospinosa TaxID=97972 RepID=A0A2V1DP35_9PLEO|nr:hypothetical protein DM02DRAFT_614735 [Periconia macrospinosa]